MRIPKDIAHWLQESLLEYDEWQWGLVALRSARSLLSQRAPRLGGNLGSI